MCMVRKGCVSRAMWAYSSLYMLPQVSSAILAFSDATAGHGEASENRPDMVYQPMLELLAYLEGNG